MGIASYSPRSAITAWIQRQRPMALLIAPAHRGLVADGLLAAFPGADAHGLNDVPDEDAPVAGLARVGGTDDRVHTLVRHLVGHHRFDLELGQQRDIGPRAAVLLGVALLAPAAHHLADREPGHPELV